MVSRSCLPASPKGLVRNKKGGPKIYGGVCSKQGDDGSWLIRNGRGRADKACMGGYE